MMESYVVRYLIVTFMLLFSTSLAGAEETCSTVYWVKSVIPVTEHRTSGMYTTTRTTTLRYTAEPVTVHPASHIFHTTTTTTITHWKTLAPTTTTVPTLASFTPIASAEKAPRHVSVVFCTTYVATAAPSIATSVVLLTRTKTISEHTPLITTSTHFVRNNLTSTVHASRATRYEACNEDNRIQKYNDQFVFDETFANNAGGENLISRCGGSLDSTEDCMLVRAATKSAHACCHAIWNLYYKYGSGPYAWTFSLSGGPYEDGNCLGVSGGSTSGYQFYNGPQQPSGEEAGGFYIGNGFGGSPYYAGYLTAYPGFS